MTTVDISGLNKVALLYNLWINQKVIAPAYMEIPIWFDDETAVKAVTKYIDYFNGRPIKTDISRNIASTWLYDRDAGKGRFAHVVEMMRKYEQHDNKEQKNKEQHDNKEQQDNKEQHADMLSQSVNISDNRSRYSCNEVLNMETMKYLCGNEKITGRQLLQENKSQSKCMI